MTWQLNAYGWRPWDEVRSLVGAAMCAWADYTGFHVGECPDEAPPYSHLWAWDGAATRLLRVRIDDAVGVVGILCRDGAAASPSGLTPLSSEDVLVESRLGLPWGDDKRVHTSTITTTMTLHELLRPLPVTFVSMP